MKKKILFLTDITLHIRGLRPTINFSKVAQKGRVYTKTEHVIVPRVENSSNNDKSLSSGSNDKLETIITWPDDLAEGIKNGDIILMIPKDGLPIIAGDDLWEYMEKIEKKRLNQSKHRGGIWKSEQTGV